jgi:hypothetical protein
MYSPNIIRVIQSKECNGRGRVVHMEERNGAYRVLAGNLREIHHLE